MSTSGPFCHALFIFHTSQFGDVKSYISPASRRFTVFPPFLQYGDIAAIYRLLSMLNFAYASSKLKTLYCVIPRLSI